MVSPFLDSYLQLHTTIDVQVREPSCFWVVFNTPVATAAAASIQQLCSPLVRRGRVTGRVHVDQLFPVDDDAHVLAIVVFGLFDLSSCNVSDLSCFAMETRYIRQVCFELCNVA